MACILNGPVRSQELDLVVLVGPFQLRIFCGSIIQSVKYGQGCRTEDRKNACRVRVGVLISFAYFKNGLKLHAKTVIFTSKEQSPGIRSFEVSPGSSQ